MEGKITRIVADKGFFFIDNDYWCHKSNYGSEPVEGDIVDYQRAVTNGKKNAEHVKFLRTMPSLPTEYLNDLVIGYFSESNYLKENFIIKYPMLLANILVQKGNKVNQIRNYFDHVLNIAGVYKTNKDFNRVKVELQKLIPTVTKSFTKKNISAEFKDFIIENVKQAIKSEDAFIKGFLPHFECLVNYYPSN